MNECVEPSVAPPLPGVVLQFFSCQNLGDGLYVMRYSLTTVCYDSTYNAYLPYAVFCVLLYPVGVPALFLAVLYSLHAGGRLEAEATRLRLGFLYEAYEVTTRSGPEK